MSKVVIKVEELSKQYRLGKIGTGTLSHDINRWWYRVRGKEDPYLKIGESNDRESKGESQYVWSLKDINFEINQGEAVGIIGRNGAGKSTLLKILSRTTAPTRGNVKIRGRVASLLEVGTGFHPELSGRENIYLNGAILGMTRAEIKRKFDEIVDFAGVARYVDTPVKRYSSGMYVRLAFGVAAHLEPEILIVDEVLAVGDAEFQKKALGKMKDVSEGEGRTVLFVSHNISAIQTLTKKCVFLKNGQLMSVGPTAEIISLYQRANDKETADNLYFKKEKLNDSKPIEMLSATLKINKDEQLWVDIDYLVRRRIGSVVSIKITNLEGVPMLTLRDTDHNPEVFTKNPGQYFSRFDVPVSFFANNIYKVTFSFSDMKAERFDYFEDLLSFEIERDDEVSSFSSKREGVLAPNSINCITKKKDNEEGRL